MEPYLILATDGDVGEELVDEEVLGQLEEVGLVVAPLEDVLLLQLRKQNQSRGHNRTNSLSIYFPGRFLGEINI